MGEKAAEEAPEEEHSAATKLQGMQRQKQAKKKVEAVRAEKAEQAEKDAAITKIQGIQRQKTATKKVEAIRAEKAAENGEAPPGVLLSAHSGRKHRISPLEIWFS